MFTEIFTEAKVKWSGGPDDYTSKNKIEKLINYYDYHYGRIDDGKKYKKAQEQNEYIKAELKKLGVSDFVDAGNNKVLVESNFKIYDNFDVSEVGR